MAGPWEKYRSGVQGVPIGMQDPTLDLKRPQAQAGIQAQQSNMQNDVVSRARMQQQMQQEAALFDERQRAMAAEAALKQMQAKQAQTETQTRDPLNPTALGRMSADAMAKLQTIDRIKRNADSGLLPTIGFGAETVAGIGGTPAKDVATDLGNLKAGGALAEVLKMSQDTGRNPFTPMSNSDVELISRNIANLDQGQSRENFDANLKNYQDAYTRAYAGAEGLKTLNAEIARLLPSIPPAKREQFKAEALRRYNQKMSTPRNAPRKPSPSGIPRDVQDILRKYGGN